MSERAGKYARFELERRFLVGSGHEELPGDRRWRISDRYISETQLRLRRMEPVHGGQTLFKLGQKQVPSPPDFARMTITNIYLSEREHEVLSQLPAREIHKIRDVTEHKGRSITIDVFEADLTGLVLAEVGFDTTEEMRGPLDLPTWLGAEVSNDVRFTGGALASLTAGQVAELIRAATRAPG